MLLRLLGIRKKSRRQRIAERVRDLVPDAPEVDLERIRPKMRQDSGRDSAALSFTGGLLLGLLIGLIVALLLSNRRDEDAAGQRRRPTQIKVLPRRDTPGSPETQAARG